MPTSMFLTITQAATASSQTNISAVPNTRADQPLYQLGSLLGPSSILPTKQVSDSLAEEIHLNRKAGAAILIKNLDSGGIPFATNKFFLTGMQQTYREKAQIMETFDGASVSFFDDAVKVYQLTGVFVEYYDDSTTPWESLTASAFTEFYNTHLRATRLVKNKRVAVLRVLNHLIEGYPLSFVTNTNSQADKMVNFSMTWLVKSHDLTAGAGGTTNFEPLYDLSQSVRAGTVSDLVNNNRAFISAVDLALPLDLRDALLLEEVQVINANKDFIISALENIRNPDQLIYKFVYSGNSSADIKNSNISKALEDLESDDYEKVKTFIRDINLALIKAQTYIAYNI